MKLEYESMWNHLFPSQLQSYIRTNIFEIHTYLFISNFIEVIKFGFFAVEISALEPRSPQQGPKVTRATSVRNV